MNEEIDKLGGVPSNARRDSPEFEAIKREVLALPTPKKSAAAMAAGDPTQPPAPASTHFSDYKGSAFTMSYPDNWGVSESDGGAAFAPKGGVVQGRRWSGRAGLRIDRQRSGGAGGWQAIRTRWRMPRSG